MASKIKVVHHTKSLGFSGTDKCAQIFAKYLAQSDRFDPYIMYQENGDTSRYDVVADYIGEHRLIPYQHEHQKNPPPPYLPKSSNFREVLTRIKPDIVHLHRSGYPEWPGIRSIYPEAKWVETNIFGHVDRTNNIDQHIYISNYIMFRATHNGNADGPVIYNPVEQPFRATEQFANECRAALIKSYGLPENAVILGRVGRADNYVDISMKAFAKIVKNHPNAFYLVVNPCEGWRKSAKKLKIEGNVRFLAPIYGDEELSRFYAGLDIYAHARSDGECCPTNIQEAMMHGLAIVSHESPCYNGQVEIIGKAGHIVPWQDHDAYARVLEDYISNKVIFQEYAWRARRRAMMLFDAECVTGNLMKAYEEVLCEK